MNDLYTDILLDHYRLPRNRGTLANETLAVEGKNPLCGDELTLHLHIEEGVVRNISFEGKGCAISMASASMLTEDLKGRPLADVQPRINQFRQLIRDGQEPAGEPLNDLTALAGVAQLPVRVKCATLPWTTMEEALKELNGK